MASTSSDNYFSYEQEAGAGRGRRGRNGAMKEEGRMIDERCAGPLDAVRAADNVDVVDDERRRGG